MKQVVNILIFLAMTSPSFAQDLLDTNLYPFENKYLNLIEGKMHYIDEGEGPSILFVHGTPTWSFLYRDIIKELSKDYRCIAIDHLGFGLSDKPDSSGGTPEWHASNLMEFIEQLDLDSLTLVVHDFGGPIGLAAGIEHSERIQKVVLFNSWLWATDQNKAALKVDKTVNTWLGSFLYLNANISPKLLLKKGFADKSKLSKASHQQYLLPFPNKASRIPLLQLAKALVGSSNWYQKQWEQLEQLENKEWLIIWGMKDEFITTEYLQKWQNRLPQAQTLKLDCGHFVQEEETLAAITAIKAFMEG